jgi:hypothetical protein
MKTKHLWYDRTSENHLQLAHIPDIFFPPARVKRDALLRRLAVRHTTERGKELDLWRVFHGGGRNPGGSI